MSAKGFVILHESSPSRSISASTRKSVVGAARVRVDGELDGVCSVTYLAVSGPSHLVGKQGSYPRADVYVTPDERKVFHDLVLRYWGPEWRGR